MEWLINSAILMVGGMVFVLLAGFLIIYLEEKSDREKAKKYRDYTRRILREPNK